MFMWSGLWEERRKRNKTGLILIVVKDGIGLLGSFYYSL